MLTIHFKFFFLSDFHKKKLEGLRYRRDRCLAPYHRRRLVKSEMQVFSCMMQLCKATVEDIIGGKACHDSFSGLKALGVVLRAPGG